MRYSAGFNKKLELAPHRTTDVAAAAVSYMAEDPKQVKEVSHVSN